MISFRNFFKDLKIYKFICIFCIIFFIVPSTSLHSAGNVFSTKSIKAIELLINSDGENNFTTGDNDIAYITGPLNIRDATGDVKIDIDEEGKIIIAPADTGNATIFEIVPSAIISTDATEWDAIRIDADSLDPSGNDVEIHGIHVDFSEIVPTGTGGDIDGITIEMENERSHALHINQGMIVNNYEPGADAGAEYPVIDVRIDISNLATTSSVHILDAAIQTGTPLGSVCLLGAHNNISVICQSIGTFSTPSQTEYAGKKHTGGTIWVDGIDGSEIFVRNNDEIYVGSASHFSEIEVDMSIVATKNCSPTFWYSTAADAWTQFYPADDTEGFQQDGIIHWLLSNISALWTNNGDPGGASTSAGYWVKIIRTVNADPGTPTPTTIKIGSITNYGWDDDGNLDINNISINADSTCDSNLTVLGNITADTIGVGTTARDVKLEVNMGTTDKVRLSYNDADGSATDYTEFGTDSNGGLTVVTVDSDGTAGNITLDPDGIVNTTEVIRGVTSLWWFAVNSSAFNAATGASGATWVACDTNTLGGYKLNADNELLYFNESITQVWDGSTDLQFKVTWEVNEVAASDGTVDLQLKCYYKGDHETSCKTQTVEVAHTITGNKARYARHVTTFTIDWDAVSNIVEVADKMSFILNLETDTSECDDIIINTRMFRYRTAKLNPEI